MNEEAQQQVAGDVAERIAAEILTIEPQIAYEIKPFTSSSGRMTFDFKDEDDQLRIVIAEHEGEGEISIEVDGYFAGVIHQMIRQQDYLFRKRPLCRPAKSS